MTIPLGKPVEATIEQIDCHNDWQLDPVTKAWFTAWYDAEALHVAFHTYDAPLYCRHFGDQTPVSQDSCVEVFIQPHHGGEYWNFEFNVGCSVNASHRFERPKPTRLSSAEIATILRRAVPEITTETIIPGNNSSWDFEVDIPWALMNVTPEKGMHMRANFYACASEGDPHYCLSWSPIATPAPDYHRPEFFGEIILG